MQRAVRRLDLRTRVGCLGCGPRARLRGLLGRRRLRRAAARPGGIMYFTDRGIEELAERRGQETVSVEWLAERLRDFLDLNPEFETPIERFATWLARLEDDDEDI